MSPCRAAPAEDQTRKQERTAGEDRGKEGRRDRGINRSPSVPPSLCPSAFSCRPLVFFPFALFSLLPCLPAPYIVLLSVTTTTNILKETKRCPCSSVKRWSAKATKWLTLTC